MPEIIWTPEYLADLEADFARFYRVDDLEAMDSKRFFRLAYRVSAYDGVMSRRIEDESQRDEDGNKKTDRHFTAIGEQTYTPPEPPPFKYDDQD